MGRDVTLRLLVEPVKARANVFSSDADRVFLAFVRSSARLQSLLAKLPSLADRAEAEFESTARDARLSLPTTQQTDRLITMRANAYFVEMVQ